MVELVIRQGGELLFQGAEEPEGGLVNRVMRRRISASSSDALTHHGFQTAHRDRKDNLYYEPTETGIAAGAVMQDTGKKKGDGAPVRQLKWSFGIVERLRLLLGKSA